MAAAQPAHALTRSFLRDSGWQASTKTSAVSCLNRWQRWCDARKLALLDAQRDDVETYLDERRAAKIAPATLHCDWRMLRAFYKWAVAEGEVDSNKDAVRDPTAKVKAPTVKETHVETLSEFEYRKLVKACDRRTVAGRRDEAILSLLWWSGLRRSEIVSLDLSSLDLDGDNAAGVACVKVPALKTDKARRAWLSQETQRALDRYLRSRGDDAGPLFLSERGDTLEDRRLRPNSIQLLVRRCAKRAGIKRSVGIHEFRRAWATNARRSGMSDGAIMSTAGWSSLRMIDRYTRAAREELAAQEFVSLMDTSRSLRRSSAKRKRNSNDDARKSAS